MCRRLSWIDSEVFSLFQKHGNLVGRSICYEIEPLNGLMLTFCVKSQRIFCYRSIVECASVWTRINTKCKACKCWCATAAYCIRVKKRLLDGCIDYYSFQYMWCWLQWRSVRASHTSAADIRLHLYFIIMPMSLSMRPHRVSIGSNEFMSWYRWIWYAGVCIFRMKIRSDRLGVFFYFHCFFSLPTDFVWDKLIHLIYVGLL